MAETFLAVAVLVAVGFLGIDNWRLRSDAKDWQMQVDEAQKLIATLTEENVTLHHEVAELMRQRSQVAPKDSPFESRDKISPTPPRRYRPLAIRRAQAETASLGPQTHDERVRANNARAMESA